MIHSAGFRLLCRRLQFALCAKRADRLYRFAIQKVISSTGAPGGSPERSQAVPFVAEETSQEKPLARTRLLHVEKRIGISTGFHKYGRRFSDVTPAKAEFQESWIPASAGMTNDDSDKHGKQHGTSENLH